jgi:hypothetical protein
MSEVKALWLRKWGLHSTTVHDLITEKDVIPYRKTPWKIYVRLADAEAYVHNPPGRRSQVYTTSANGASAPEQVEVGGRA